MISKSAAHRFIAPYIVRFFDIYQFSLYFFSFRFSFFVLFHYNTY